MTQTTNQQRAEEIADASRRVGIPISDDHALTAAKWGSSLQLASKVVRAIDYQDHEPCNVFNPVVLNDKSRENGNR